MGNSSSSSAAPPPPPVIIEDPYPAIKVTEGVSLSQAYACNDCVLEVNTNISSSSVKATREVGDIKSTDCAKYALDRKRVEDKFMSLSDFISGIQEGKYSRPTSQENVPSPTTTDPTRTRSQPYCEVVTITDEDAAAVKSVGELDGKVKGGRIRKVSGSGGFSLETKARFLPSIPFKMKFKGTKNIVNERGKLVGLPFNDEFSVTQLTLYHPSPIRVDAVQADAMLSLNDPSDPNAKIIVLIPLKGTNNDSDSSKFIGRIARETPRLNDPVGAGGTYAVSDIPTGADWTLAKLFTFDKDMGAGGPSRVKNGFFTWTGTAGYERYRDDLASLAAGANVTRYKWRRIPSADAPQYFLLDSPLDINSADLATLTRNIDSTPPADAVHPIPSEMGYIFHKASEPPAPDTISGKGSCGITNICEGMANQNVGTLDELLETKVSTEACPNAKCDPFLQNANNVELSTFTPRNAFTFLFNVLIFVAMLIGAYVAMNMVGNDYDLKLRDVSEAIGKVLAVWSKSMVTKVANAKNSLGSFMAAKALAKAGPLGALAKAGPLGAVANLSKKLPTSVTTAVQSAKTLAETTQ